MKEIFDRVKTHLLAQGERAIRVGHVSGEKVIRCAYHSQSGLKCAVGCLITDEAYSEALEGAPVDVGHVRGSLEASGIVVDLVTLGMLCKLQSIHDDEVPDRWEHSLDNLEAKLFGGTE